MKKLLTSALALIVSNMFGQIRQIETQEACGTGSSSVGYDVDVHGDNMLATGLGMTLYRFCDGNWSPTWITSGGYTKAAVGINNYAGFYPTSGTSPVRVIASGSSSYNVVGPVAGSQTGRPVAFASDDIATCTVSGAAITVYTATTNWGTAVSLGTGTTVASSNIATDDDDVAGVINDVVKIYHKSSGTWSSTALLNHSVSGLLYSLDFSDDNRLVVASLDGNYDVTVWVFEDTGGGWVLASGGTNNPFTFASTCGANNLAAQRVAMDGNYIFVSDMTSSGADGIVRVFHNDGTDWNNELTSSTPGAEMPITIGSDGAGSVEFGTYGLAASNGHLIIGAPGVSKVYAYEIIESYTTHLLINASSTKGTTWEVRDVANGNTLVAQSPTYSATCQSYDHTIVLPDINHWYNLTVSQTNNSLCSGGFIWQVDGSNKIWDVSEALSLLGTNNLSFASVTSSANTGYFYPPLGAAHWNSEGDLASRNTWLQTTGTCEVKDICSSQYTNCSDPSTTGYQWQWFRPNAGDAASRFIRNAGVTISVPQQPNNPGSGCSVVEYINPGPFTTTPVPTNTRLNLRMRARVNGVDRGWGPVRRIRYTGPQARPRISAWPNPLSNGSNSINLRSEDGWFALLAIDDVQQVTVEVSDLMGRVVHHSSSSVSDGSDLNINFLTPLSSGIYLVNVRSGEEVGTARLFVE